MIKQWLMRLATDCCAVRLITGQEARARPANPAARRAEPTVYRTPTLAPMQVDACDRSGLWMPDSCSTKATPQPACPVVAG